MIYNGIEDYVTPVYEKDNKTPIKYLSRSKEYYNVKSMTQLSEEREKKPLIEEYKNTNERFNPNAQICIDDIISMVKLISEDKTTFFEKEI